MIGSKYKNKKAVSLMLSYVILISIAVIMSITVFAWLKLIANIEPVKSCDESTSIIINDYVCKDNNTFILTVKNNGRFSVDGFILTVGNTTKRVPTTRLIPLESISKEGYLLFDPSLKPGELNQTIFTNTARKKDGGIGKVDFNFIRNLRIQSYIIDEESREKIFCSNIINQDIENCQIK